VNNPAIISCLIELNAFLAGIISLLDEDQNEVKSFALKKLNFVVNEFWPEIADYMIKM